MTDALPRPTHWQRKTNVYVEFSVEMKTLHHVILVSIGATLFIEEGCIDTYKEHMQAGLHGSVVFYTVVGRATRKSRYAIVRCFRSGLLGWTRRT